MMKREQLDGVRKIIKYCEEHGEETDFEWSDVRVPPNVLNKLVFREILKVTHASTKHRYYALDMPLKELRQMFTSDDKTDNDQISIPNDLFDTIVGHEDVKDVLKRSLQADKPVHILFVGSPATGKSLFLAELERLGATYILGSTLTKVGIRDILFESLPKLLIVDEIDKVNNSKDLSSLLSWMNEGRVSIAIHNRKETKCGKGWVFAAGNSLNPISPALRSRFNFIFKLDEYSRDEFCEVVRQTLTSREGTDPQVAEVIADSLADHTTDVRKAIGIARLADGVDDAKRLIEIFIRSGGVQ